MEGEHAEAGISTDGAGCARAYVDSMFAATIGRTHLLPTAHVAASDRPQPPSAGLHTHVGKSAQQMTASAHQATFDVGPSDGPLNQVMTALHAATVIPAAILLATAAAA